MEKTVLVTGISGFIAKHVAKEFLEAGYKVRGTVRSKAKSGNVLAMLKPYSARSELELVEADLVSDKGWTEAVEGCTYVAHVASPFPLVQPKDDSELIRPAVDGTLRVLNASRDAGVERVVQTSSLVAVMHGHTKDKSHFTEDDWTNIESPHTTVYAKSKTLAERAAREFAAENSKGMKFCTVNPGVVWGPTLDGEFGSSLSILQMLLEGKYPGCPKLCFPVVDVRDVARMHRLAMETTEPTGGRYFAVADTVWMLQAARALKRELGERARKVPPRELPNFIVRLVAIVDPAVRAVLPDLGRQINIDNGRTKKALGMDFITVDEAAVSGALSLLQHGAVRV